MKKSKKVSNAAEDKVQQASTLSDKQMVNLLVELGGTDYFQAIKQYTQQREEILDQTFRTFNFANQSHEAARHQGIYLGLNDLIQAVEIARSKREDGQDTGTPGEIV